MPTPNSERQTSVIRPRPGSFSEEVEHFLDTAAADSGTAEMVAHAPRLDGRLQGLDRERTSIVNALSALPVGGRMLASNMLGRIRTLAVADNRAAFDCYWSDLGGEGGA